jgi:hypothetical protein
MSRVAYTTAYEARNLDLTDPQGQTLAGALIFVLGVMRKAPVHVSSKKRYPIPTIKAKAALAMPLYVPLSISSLSSRHHEPRCEQRVIFSRCGDSSTSGAP